MPIEKPKKPTELIPRAFGGIKNNFSDDLQSTGFEPNIPQTYNGDNLNYHLDATGKELDYVEKVVDFINQTPVNHVPFVNENNQLDYVDKDEFGGGGLEIGDIGIAPLGIDETQNKRRYLNGQIIIQEQFASFTEKLKNAIALYPSLACTENEWQTKATMTVGGQVGKFVVDDDAGTIRLPKIIMPIQGLTDLSKLAEIVEAGLPNITGRINPAITTTSSGNTNNLHLDVDGAFYTSGRDKRNYFNAAGTATVESNYDAGFNASRSNSIYGNSDTVQQEQIQYPYFIQVATGAEESIDTTRAVEINNPFFLGMSQYFESTPNNPSWLKSQGQYNSKAVYPDYYDWLLRIYNGTETQEGVSVKLSTEAYTDYDFVISQADETFRLPLLNGSEDIPNLEGAQTLSLISTGEEVDIPCYGFLKVRCTSCGYININQLPAVYSNSNGESKSAPMNVTSGLLVKGKASVFFTGTMTDLVFIPARGNGALYYYVGEGIVNPQLVNVARIEEIKANKTDVDGQWIHVEVEHSLVSGEYALPKNSPVAFDISNIIPNDGYQYEITLNLSGKTNGTTNAVAYIAVGAGTSKDDENNTGNFPVAYVKSQASNAVTFANTVKVILRENTRTVYVIQQSNDYTATLSSLRLQMYRRLGKNI